MRPILNSKVLLLLLGILNSLCFSQPKDLKFDQLTSVQGLPALCVSCVLQDKQGFLWIATEGEGLLRFDGYNYKIFKTSSDEGSLSNNTVQYLFEDSKGTLWVGTFDGLNKFSKKTEKFIIYRQNPSIPGSISDNIINCIYEDKQGMLWLGTVKGGLNKFDGEKFISHKNIPGDSNSITNNDVRCIFEDNSSNLWIGTNNGLNKFDKVNTFTQFMHDEKNENTITGNIIRAIHQDSKGNIWIATNSGLNKLDMNKSNGKFFRYLNNPPKYIMSICENDNGFLWLAAIGGLVIFDPQTEIFKEYQSNENNSSNFFSPYLPSVYKDKTGTIWISTGLGITYYNPNKTTFNHYFNSSAVSSLNTDKNNNLYIGTEGNGLWFTDESRGTERRILYNDKQEIIQAHNFVVSINSSIPGKLLIGFERDLYEYDVNNKTFTKFPGKKGRFRIWDILVDRHGLIWLAPMTEIVILDSNKKEITAIKHTEDPSSLTEGFVTTLLEDKNGVIWAGTTSGLNKITISRQTNGSALSFSIMHFKNIQNDTNSISGNNITSLYEDNEGVLWIGTHTGLNKFDKNTEKFIRYTESNGLGDNSVRAILPDNFGNLWISTVSGLSRFTPKTAKFRNYGTADGLPDIFLPNSRHKSSKGELFFGSGRGVVSFLPEQIKENSNIPEVVITSFKVLNKEVSLPESILLTEEVLLSYKENFFSFEFSALDYTNPMKNQYAYMLEGIDKDWVKTTASKREAGYTDIAPGEYIFRVKGSNNDGVWNETGKSIKLIITPPLWLTW